MISCFLVPAFLSFLKKRIVFHRDFLAPSGSGFGVCLPSFVSFLFSGMGHPMNSLLRMNVVETWFVAVWGLCWCNFSGFRRNIEVHPLDVGPADLPSAPPVRPATGAQRSGFEGQETCDFLTNSFYGTSF